MAHIYLTETETPQGGYQMFLKAFTEMPTPNIVTGKQIGRAHV